MTPADVYRAVDDAAEAFRRECATPSGSGINAAYRSGFYEGLNVARRAIESALRQEQGKR